MKKIILSALLLSLAACDGPWNTYPKDSPPLDPKLRLSLFAVGGRNWDTLWLDRTQSLTVDYDSTRAFLRSAVVEVFDQSGARAMSYHQVPSNATAWVPDSQRLVRPGMTYVLKARVEWNADPDWPNSSTWKTTDLEATTSVPASWSIDHTADAPVEMLIPALAAGAEIGKGTSLLDSLDRRFPGWTARWSMDSAMLDSLRQGLPVFRTVRSGDTLWFISDDDHSVLNFDGKTVKRDYREILIHQHPGPGFSGVFSVNRFDPRGERILDPVTKAFRASTGKKSWGRKDSSSLFQPGDLRYSFGPYPAYEPSIFGWPSINPLSNLVLAYTGANTLYFYSVDSQYIVYQAQLSRQAGGDKTALPYTNVKGGSGYFAAALVDSFHVFLRAEGVQMFSVPALRSAACRQSYQDAKDDGRRFIPDPVCTGVPLN